MDGHEFLRKYHAGEPLTTDDIADAIERILDGFDNTIAWLDSREVEEEETPHMGAFDTVPNITIPDPDDSKASEAFRKKWKWDAHEQIIIKGSFTAGDREEMENASSSLEGKGKNRAIKMKTGSARLILLEQMIVDWTLTDQGRRVEVTPKNIKRLPSNYQTPVLEACDEIAKIMDEDEQEDFLDSSNEPTKAS